MPGRVLSRRSSLLLPLLLGACGRSAPREYRPLHYGYLEPLRLNVAAIRIEQRFVPSGIAPDVSQLDPVLPVDALRNMATDRLQAFGTSGQAVFIIEDASLTRDHDTINGSMAVQLDIYTSANSRAGFAEARVSRRRSGDIDDMASTLYDMTKDMMDAMNVEFEFQLRRSLNGWLVPAGAAAAPVQRQELNPAQPAIAPGAPGAMPPPMPAPIPVPAR